MVAVLDRLAELEALYTGDHCPPEAAQVLPALVQRVGFIKALSRGRREHPRRNL
jgi:hypothetical protein